MKNDRFGEIPVRTMNMAESLVKYLSNVQLLLTTTGLVLLLLCILGSIESKWAIIHLSRRQRVCCLILGGWLLLLSIIPAYAFSNFTAGVVSKELIVSPVDLPPDDNRNLTPVLVASPNSDRRSKTIRLPVPIGTEITEMWWRPLWNDENMGLYTGIELERTPYYDDNVTVYVTPSKDTSRQARKGSKEDRMSILVYAFYKTKGK
jgi:hypothetical protein